MGTQSHSGRPRAAPSWTHREPGLRAAREALAFAWPRVRAHWLSTLLVAAILTGATVLWRSRVPRTYDASVVVRVTEPDYDTKAKPPSERELTSFINEVFLTRSKLLAIIEEHGLYPDLSDRSLALEAMREDLDVRVVQNYFAPERYMALPVRSARMVVSYAGPTPDVALAVVRQIGELVSAEQARVRQQMAESAAARATSAQRALQEQLMQVRRRQTELNIAPEVSHLATVELARLIGEATTLEAELDRLRDESSRVELQSALEAQRLGMRFDLVDTGRRPTPGMSRSSELALIGVVAFLVLLTLTAIGIGTLGTRILSDLAITRLGMTPLGTLPWPPHGALQGGPRETKR